MKRSIDLMKVNIEGIDRKPYDKESMEKICKQAGQIIFQKADCMEMLEIGRDLTECNPINIHEDVAEKIKAVFREGFLFFIHTPINKFIKEQFEKPLSKVEKK